MEGRFCEIRKTKEGGCKNAGGGKGKGPGGNLGFWRLGGLGPVWATHSRFSKQFYFAKQFWQLIFENGDDRLGKIFSDNFWKNKIGFNKNNFYCQKHALR